MPIPSEMRGHVSRLMRDDDKSGQKWFQHLSGKGAEFIERGFDYVPVAPLGGQNSNSFAREIMQRTGLGDISLLNRYKIGVWAPLWENDPWFWEVYTKEGKY
ncbi:MAG: hypothetical protein H7145_16205 [Akkermansiaceae bacterium]|nr:hypothetical protein [Armatimonadota bacterium]